MIELVSINVENFRSFSEASFAPLGVGQGMTAINGANGMGKSTLVHALLWAVYGITPDGVPVKSLRRQNSEGDVIANVVLRHEGQTIEVTRSLRGRNDTTMATIVLDGVEQTNISSKTATLWMEKRLNLDSEAFLTVFVVRQKELDSLVKARPAERRKTIERLAGIERMSAALTLARQEARDAQKMLEALPVTQSLEEATAEFEKAEQRLNEALRNKDNAENDFNDVKNKYEDASNALTESEKHLNQLKDIHNSLTLLRQKSDSLNENLQRVSKLVEGAEDLPHAQSLFDEATENLKEAEKIVASVEIAISNAEKSNQRFEEIEAELSRVSSKKEKALQEYNVFKESIVVIENIEQKISDAEKKVESLGIERGAARGEWDRLKKAIETLTESLQFDHSECPTCSQHLPDPIKLIESQQDLLESVKQRGVDLTSKYEEAVKGLSELQKLETQQNSDLNKLENFENTLANIDEELSRVQNMFNKANDEAESNAEIADSLQKQAAAIENDIPALKNAQTLAQANLIKAEQAIEALEEQETIKENLASIIEQIDNYEFQEEGLKKLTKDIDYDEFISKVNSLQADMSAASDVYSSAKTTLLLAERDIEEAKNSLTAAEKSAEVRKQALAKVEVTAAAASSLEEFRRDRLARLAPELSEVASDFVARMTDGRYVSVELDEDFTPILTDSNGSQRPSSWLSGGEESAVALALRVAIGEVLAGQRGGVLILDEVLTAQDQTRRTATMAAIRALPRQIITINHVSEATDMVDLVAEIVYDENVEGASTVSVYSPDNGVSSDLTDYMVDA